MTIGGGLYDHDPWGRDRPPGPAPDQRAKAREWMFWALMTFMVWAAFQGQVLTTVLFLLMIGTVPAVIYLYRSAAEQIQESKKKGFWR